MTLRKTATGEVLGTSADQQTDQTLQHTASQQHSPHGWTDADVEDVLDEEPLDNNED